MYFDGKRVFDSGNSALDTLVPSGETSPAPAVIPGVRTPETTPEVSDEEILGDSPLSEELLRRGGVDLETSSLGYRETDSVPVASLFNEYSFASAR